MPSFTRRSGPGGTAAEEQGRDDYGKERAERPGRPETAVTRNVKVREQIDDRGPDRAAGAATVTRDKTEVRQQTADREVTEPMWPEPARPEPARPEPARPESERPDGIAVERVRGPRARSSLLATLGLVIGITAALTVLTGALAGYGVALSVIGLLLSLGGVSATSRRYIAGKSEALVGTGLNVGAMVLGGLVLTGALGWLTVETDAVQQARQWLDTQFIERF